MEMNSRGPEVRFRSDVRGWQTLQGFPRYYQNQYLFDRWIIVGGMLFRGVPISSSQAGLCAETWVVHRSTKIVHGGTDCAQGHGLCAEARVVHRSTRLCPETQGFVHRGTERVVRRCQRSRGDRSFSSFSKDRLGG